ncbi:MAG: CRTAC1 family protein [Vicinamibacterales bacterium]
MTAEFRVRGMAAMVLLLGGFERATSGDSAAFRESAVQVGLTFDHVNGARGAYHLPEIMGSGCALFDYDLDGDLDALLLQGGPLDGQDANRHVTSGPRLFRNDLSSAPGAASSLHFTDVTDRAGFARGNYGMGIAVGDYDSDGDPDLYLTNYGPNRLYRNNGNGTFVDVTDSAGEGLGDPRWSTSASFADYDGDGDLDLFVANYVDFTIAGAKACSDPTGVRDYCGPLQFRPVPDRLFRNNGNGTLTDVTESSGVMKADGPGLGVAAADFNGDGRIDFYVANDATANQLWINRGNGTFADEALLAGIALNADGGPEGSMGLAIGDPDNDGDLDIFITNITRETHAFYRNVGAGRFEDARIATGLGAATALSTGFGTDWFDYDNDGWLDLFVANGAVTIIEALRGERFPFRQRNQLFRSLANGRFADVTRQVGPAFEPLGVGRGAAFGDVDNDGDVDVLTTNNDGPVRLLLNETARRFRSLQFRLLGITDNRQGLGARVGIRWPGGRTVWRRAHTDGSYLSASDPRVHFGLGTSTSPSIVIVEWPSGAHEAWPIEGNDGVITLKQGTGKRAE